MSPSVHEEEFVEERAKTTDARSQCLIRRVARLRECNEQGRRALVRFKQEWAAQAAAQEVIGGRNPAKGGLG